MTETRNTTRSLQAEYSARRKERDSAIYAEWTALTAGPSKKDIKAELAAKYGVSVNTVNQIIAEQRKARRTAKAL